MGGFVWDSREGHWCEIWRDENREEDSQNACPLRPMDLYDVQTPVGIEHRLLSSVSRVLWFERGRVVRLAKLR